MNTINSWVCIVEPLFVLFSLVILFQTVNVFAHPFTNFNFNIMDGHGFEINPGVSIGIANNLTRVYFQITTLKGGDIVNLKQLMPMHDRYIHVLIISFDSYTAFHVHPDDFGSLQQMSSSNATWFVDVNFPESGIYEIAASFMFMNVTDFTMLEGFAQSFIGISGSPGQRFPTSWDYTTKGRFRTYPIGSDEVFNNFVDTSTNRDNNGVYVELNIADVSDDFSTLTYVREQQNNNVLAKCSVLQISVYADENKTPIQLVPYLGAPVHFTMFNEYDALYHLHGMRVLPGYNYTTTRQFFLSQVKMANGDLSTLARKSMGNEDAELAMEALYMGMTKNGDLDCLSDMGITMDQTGMMMMADPPKSFGPNILGIFDFPNTGNWRLFAYFKVQFADGTQALLVPDFAIKSIPLPSTIEVAH